ncbi:hypothetical protein CONPUDRAFT_146865 [Coniophora puteana RWD-64-598 SS2]|uniref:Uncharacterized protein n=1 Tax=Coniophora puteana (strain RWD-64-598) TaxID=741705 RepID=A0A5M3MCT5_CONPW|nr:uncharacterized protein CONPUDRAFT_146865 [Coniophora puteana RWD-64-598 SS2]EIW76451.1 hypothetical protein CONPUDRAFT_146865 [Coniophora puteana RWD-64-598 SS2]
MPAPAATVAILAVSLVAGAAVIATLKELVYEPHIAPAIERWAEEFLAKRRARQQRQTATAVPSTNPMDTTALTQTYDQQDDEEDRQAALELEEIVAREVDEWRNEVHRSRTLPRPDEDGGVGTSGLRLRKKSRGNLPEYGGESGIGTGTSLEEETIISLPYTPLSPTHVIANVSSNGAATSIAHSSAVSGSDTTTGIDPSPDPTTLTENPSNPFVDTDADEDGSTTSNRTSLALTDYSLMPYDSISNCFSPAGPVPPLRPPTPPSAPAAPPARTVSGHTAVPPSEASTMRAPTIMSLQPISPPMSLDAIFSPDSGYGFNINHPFSPPAEEPLSPPMSPPVQLTRSQTSETKTETETQLPSRPRPQPQGQGQSLVSASREVSRIASRASSNASTHVIQRIPLSPPQGSIRSLSERYQAPSSPPVFVDPLDALSARSSSPASSFAIASRPPSTRALSPPRDSRIQRVASQDPAPQEILSPLMGSRVGTLRTPPPASSGLRSPPPSAGANVKRSTSGSGPGVVAGTGSGPGSRPAAAPTPRTRSGSVSSNQSSGSVIQRIPMSPPKVSSPSLPTPRQLQQQQYQQYQNQTQQPQRRTSASGMSRSSSRQSQSSSSGSVVQRLHGPSGNASRVTSPSRSSSGRTSSPFIDLSASTQSMQSLSSTGTSSRSRRTHHSSSRTISDTDFLSVGSDSDDGVLSVSDGMSPPRRGADASAGRGASGDTVRQVLSPALSPVRSPPAHGTPRAPVASRSHRHAGSAFGMDDFSDGESADEWVEARRR